MTGAASAAEVAAHPAYADPARDAAALFPLMRELRPHLASPAEFAARWQRQAPAGYRIAALWSDGKPVALAGFRLQDNLMHGLHLYIDDLVTAEGARSCGHGGRLIAFATAEARRLGCGRLVLDTALGNTLGHRFYYRNGLLATALRFSMALT